MGRCAYFGSRRRLYCESFRQGLVLETDRQQVADDLEIELVEAAASGDLDSFGKLARQYYPAITAVGYSVVGDHAMAEDAAQECFARAIVSLRSLRNKERFAPWLAAICRNVAKDMLRQKIRRAKLEANTSTANNESGRDSVEAVLKAIGKLGAADKEVVMLRYYQNLPYERIAAVMGISPAAVNGRLTRAKRKMAKYLKADGFGKERL